MKLQKGAGMKKIQASLLLMILIVLGGFAQQVHADSVQTKSLYVLEKPTWLDNAGISKGIYHDKQDLGIILPANVQLEIRQTNPDFQERLTMELLNDDSQKEKSVNITSNWQVVSNAYTAVPFIDTTFGKEAPVLEYKVTNTMKTLPIYHKGDNEAAFFQQWDNSNAEFALIYSKYFQTFVPKKDKAYMKRMRDFSSIDGLIDYYTDVFETYNKLDGLSFTPENPTDKNISNKYFMKANAHGAGAAYYGGDHTAQNSDSLADFYLSKGWGGLHEIAHGYQGSFMNDSSFNVGEVWNNIYAAAYEKKTMGTRIFQDGWLYNYGDKPGMERRVINLWQTTHTPVNNWDVSSKLLAMVTLQNKAGDDAFILFNKEHRKMANTPGYEPSNHYLLDLISRYYGQASGFDFTPTILSFGGTMSTQQQEDNRSRNYKPVAPITELVPASQLTTIQNRLGLETPFALVDTDQLASSELSGSAMIHLKIDDFSQLEGQYLVLTNGTKEIKRVKITSKDLNIGTLPNGIYTINLPTGKAVKYSFDTHYLRVKEATNDVTVTYTAKKASPLISQTIHFLGLGDGEFATAIVDLNKEKLTMALTSTSPHVYFGSTEYAKLEILDLNNNVIYTKSMSGSGTVPSKDTPTIKVGYKVRVYHAEPVRLKVDNLPIVNTAQKTNTFTVTKAGLVNDNLRNNAEEDLVARIHTLAEMIQANPLIVNNDYAEVKDDLLLAIDVLSEPMKTTLLDRYVTLLPKEAATSIETSVNQIQAGDQDSGQVIATISPSKANQAVTYQSSDSEVITVDASGNWTAKGAGEAVITVTSVSNPELVKTIAVQITTVLTPEGLTAKQYNMGDAKLTGTFGTGISYVRLWINGKAVTQAITKADGTYEILNAASYIIKPTDKIEVVGVDTKYVEKNRITVTASGESMFDDTLTVDSYEIGSDTVTGTFGKSIWKVRLWVNGKAVAQATTNSDGSYTFTNVAGYIRMTSDEVEIVGVDTQYTEVKRIAATLTGTSTIDNTITAETYRIGDEKLSGNYGKDVFKVRLWVNGKIITQANTSSGEYTFTNIASFVASPLDVVQVVAVDSQYKEINRIDIDTTGLALYNYVLTTEDYTLGDSKIHGNYGKDITEVKLSVGGQIVQTATVDKKTRNYSFTNVDTLITNNNASVRIIGYNAQHQEVKRIALNIE
ncbi:hypothetical protein BMT55_09205 [Listeria newyorkensis]|uniref:Peptidase M60 domain-containing protein n=1 Tax=Listeria newyorkensis TaxID=1497681 RepID=A0ABX4XNY0_9LIST|nr:immunoglobulin-like domain-containing protein [Listeria newyorkensis]PNP92137.1 hypothetical protein BMT55_09205 [Listeria newyorkensis]WAO20284.1 M60 family metallopeptidase [Listeria newyorkensis]SQC54731.1 Viral enhancin protein [Listeria newyorkensis]